MEIPFVDPQSLAEVLDVGGHLTDRVGVQVDPFAGESVSAGLDRINEVGPGTRVGDRNREQRWRKLLDFRTCEARLRVSRPALVDDVFHAVEVG